MALPSILKNFNIFNDGISYMGVAEEIKMPKLKRKTDDYRGAGMTGPVELDLGNEKLELEFTCGGFMRQVFEQYGAQKVDGVMLRFAGAYQEQGQGKVQAVEIVVRGRHNEIDPGDGKGGDKGKLTVKSALSYYKLSLDGKDVIELDLVNMIEVINGVDMIAAQRKAIGL